MTHFFQDHMGQDTKKGKQQLCCERGDLNDDVDDVTCSALICKGIFVAKNDADYIKMTW